MKPSLFGSLLVVVVAILILPLLVDPLPASEGKGLKLARCAVQVGPVQDGVDCESPTTPLDDKGGLRPLAKSR